MLNRLTSVALGVVILLLPATRAQAQFLSGGNISGCGGNEFISCATWSALAKGDTLVLTVTNTSNLAPASNSNSAFTEIGLGDIGLADPTHFSATGAGSWGFDSNVNGFNGFGLVANTFGANSNPGNPAVKGLAAGHTVTFKFWWTTPVDTSKFDHAQIAIHDQGGPNEDCSSKVVWNGNTGAVINGASDSTVTRSCGGGGSTVPEPSSVLLMGSALIGLAGTGTVRRWRK